MFDNLTGLGWGVVTFAITIGIGAVVLVKFGNAVADCAGGYTYNESISYSDRASACYEASNSTNVTSPSNGATNTLYLGDQLGTSGLAGWAPAIIAFAVGMLFLGAFLVKKGSDRSY